MKNNSVKISTLFTKLNQHRINPLLDQETDAYKSNILLTDSLKIISHSLNRNELLKTKLEITSDDKNNFSQGVSKQQIVKSINIQGKARLNPLENNNTGISQIREQPFMLKLQQGDTKKYPLYDHQKLIQDKKCNSLSNIKTEINNHARSLENSKSNNILKTQQEQNSKQVLAQTEQLIYSIDRGFSVNVQKNKTEQFRNKNFISSNERVQSVPTDRQMNNIISNQLNLSPNQQIKNDNNFKNGIQKKLTTFNIKPTIQNNFQKNQQPLISKIYFNQNPYQLSQAASFTDSNKVSTKNSSYSHLMQNNNNNEIVPKRRISRKTFTEYQYNDQEEQHQENLSLYLLYREQQREQDKKLREISSKQRSVRNSQINKLNGNSIIDCLQGINRNDDCIQDKNSNKQQNEFALPLKEQELKMKKAISQPTFKNDQIKRLSNNTYDMYESDDENAKYLNQDNISRGMFTKEQSLKNSRSQSFQTLLAQKANKSIQFENGEKIEDDESELVGNTSKSYKNNKGIEEDEDDDEDVQYPISQANNMQKKNTQNATMQTTFTETIPEIIAKELDFIPKQYKTNNNKKKKERLISFFSIKDKKFLSTTTDFLNKYENEFKNPKVIINKDYQDMCNQDNKGLINSKSINQQDFYDSKEQNRKIHASVKSLTQELKPNVQEFDQEISQNNEIQLMITVYTSKMEFLSQLYKKIQKNQANNMHEKKKLQDGSGQQLQKQMNTYSNYLDDQITLSNTLSQNFQINKRVVFQIESDDVLKKIKESNNPQLYELLKSYQLNGSLQSLNSFKESEQISIGPLAEISQSQKSQTKFNHSKGKIVCNIILKKSRNKTVHHYDINTILQQTSNAYKSQLLSQSLSNK